MDALAWSEKTRHETTIEKEVEETHVPPALASPAELARAARFPIARGLAIGLSVGAVDAESERMACQHTVIAQ